MNDVRCQNCGNSHTNNESFCLQCGNSLLNRSMPSYPQSYQPLAGFQNAQFSGANLTQINFSPTLGRKVWVAYLVYCEIVALTIFAFVAPGLLFTIIAIFSNDEGSDAARTVFGVYSIFGLVCLLPFAVAPFFPKKPWAWIYGILLMIAGSLTCAGLVFTIPLFIYWMKPETESYFGRK